MAGVIGHSSVETGKDDARLSDRDAVAVASCLDLIEKRKEFFASKGYAFFELREQYLPIDDLKFPDCESTTAGYVDYCIINNEMTYAEMVDYKFGYWTVESAENNLQACAYMLGLFKKFPALRQIRFFFKLPNVDGVSEVALDRDQIPAVYLRVQVVVARARVAREAGDYETATPSSPLCSFCANIGNCPKVAGLMINVARKFYALAVPENISPAALISPKDTAACMRLADTVKVWAAAYKARVTDRVLSGLSPLPDGAHLETRRGDRQVASAEQVEVIAKRYLSQEEYDKLKPKPVPAFGALESAISEKAPRNFKELTVKAFAEALESEGAVVRGDSYSFIKWTNDTKEAKAKRARQEAVSEGN